LRRTHQQHHNTSNSKSKGWQIHAQANSTVVVPSSDACCQS
jgi:hypothetical protein